MQLAEVINVSTAFKQTRNKNPDKGYYPLGTIECMPLQSKSGTRQSFYASPSGNFKHIPCVGEHVQCFSATNAFASVGATESRGWYYIAPLSIHGNVHLNPLPNKSIGEKKEYIGNASNTLSYLYSGAPRSSISKPYKPGENFTQLSNVRNLQPYEGDVLIEGRHGHGLRFSSGIKGILSQYGKTPFWSADQGMPITILSNGFKNEPSENRYRIETPDDTESIIMLTSKQSITNFKIAHTNISAKSPGVYKKSQVIVSANRLHFNSKIDEIILSAKKDVVIATPNWAMQLDTLYTEIEKLIQINVDLATGKFRYATPGGPTVSSDAAPSLQKILQKIKSMKQ